MNLIWKLFTGITEWTLHFAEDMSNNILSNDDDFLRRHCEFLKMFFTLTITINDIKRLKYLSRTGYSSLGPITVGFNQFEI